MPNPTSKLNLVINGVTSKLNLVINGVTTQLDIHDANAVDLTNNQTIGGIKTFSNAPVVSAISLDGKSIDTDANGNMTYDSHIVDTIEEQGEEYIRYSNGIQICWGYVDAGVTVTINFPKSFLKRPSISVTNNTTDTNSVVTAQATNQTMTACCNFEYYGSFYIAIGRWK